ncbi:lipase family protein [Nocardioides sp. WS12]|uniref:lipase family protein n=1 Tax=Nocardioides sp. WS12 TaxID=2486272 RepID=UPI0015F7D96D|nr:lipase family protein [Nocardioides sp. WS12]
MQETSRNGRRGWVLVAAVALLATLIPAGQTAQAAPVADRVVAAAAATPDPFYTYTGTKRLADFAPGSVLKTRTVSYSIAGIPLPLKVVQIVFRTTNQRGQAVAGVTSVFKPLAGVTSKVMSYQSFYDSLNPEDGPSRSVAGGTNPGGMAAHFETAMMVPFLLQGYAIVMSDTQGPTADFAAGPEYGMVTLDSLRATLKVPATGVVALTAKIGLIGYSGGAIATNWASVLAPSYAPDINKRLVGAAEGGVLVRPATNLTYVDGSLVWAGIVPMAVVGVARSFNVDLRPYLSAYGVTVYNKMQKASILQVLGAYPGLTWKKLVKPAYTDPSTIPIFVKLVNQLNLGARPNPTIPMLIGQGTGGELEGTIGNKAPGRGDGVMVAGDVRTLAKKYCSGGVKVTHREYPLSHFLSVPFWLAEAVPWLMARFAGTPAGNNCATIPAGNPLGPLKAR